MGYAGGAEIVFHAVSNFTDQFGAATFMAVLSDRPEPTVIRDVVARITP
jgi:hypothetical protein